MDREDCEILREECRKSHEAGKAEGYAAAIADVLEEAGCKESEVLQDFVRQKLKDGLLKCRSEHNHMFKRMYSHENLSADLNDVVDAMPVDKLDWAMRQVERTIEEYGPDSPQEPPDA